MPISLFDFLPSFANLLSFFVFFLFCFCLSLSGQLELVWCRLITACMECQVGVQTALDIMVRIEFCMLF